MCAIQIIDSIMRSTLLVVYICDNISALRRASIHPKSVTSRWKQADLISCLSDVYYSIDSGILLVHVYGHPNSGRFASTLTPLASCNIRLDTLVEHIVASFLSLSAPIFHKNTTSGGIHRFIRTNKRIHLRSPSPLQSCPVYFL